MEWYKAFWYEMTASISFGVVSFEDLFTSNWHRLHGLGEELINLDSEKSHTELLGIKLDLLANCFKNVLQDFSISSIVSLRASFWASL